MSMPILIDSGAFSVWTGKADIKLDEYIAWIHSTVKTTPNLRYVNLDVIGDAEASYNNYREMIRQGLNPMPVYHHTTPIKWLKRYLKLTDWISLGGLVFVPKRKQIEMLDKIWEDYLIDKDKMPKYKVQGLGIGSFEVIKRYPWHSVDSTSWLKFAFFGKCWVPRNKQKEWVFGTSPFLVGFSNQSGTIGKKEYHFETLNPIQKKYVLSYLEYAKTPVGSLDEKGEVKETGLSNSQDLRAELNIFYVASFVQSMDWPRPFLRKSRKGLFDVE